MELPALPIPDYPAYTINPLGEVLLHGAPAPLRKSPGRSLKIRLRHNGLARELGLAKLVAQLFVPNPHNYSHVLFKDGNNHHCTADNIEWVSKADFARYSYRKIQQQKKKVSTKQKGKDQFIKPCADPTAVSLPDYRGYYITPCAKIYRGNRLLTPHNTNNKKSLQLRILYRGKVHHLGLAKLVASQFIPNPHNLPRTIFKDGNNKNCAASNIVWATEREYKAYQAAACRPPLCPTVEESRQHAVVIPGFPGYSITRDGKVFNATRMLQGLQSPGKAARVKLVNADEKSIRLTIAKLLALTFIPNPDNHPKTIFKDRDKNNCTVDNIAWVSLSEFNRFVHTGAETYELLGPPKRKKQPVDIWIDPERVEIEGIPGFYISPQGVVYKGNKIVKPVDKKGQSLKMRIHPPGWPRGKYLYYGLGKLIAEYFIPNPRGHKYIIFKDRNNRNCTAENIAWVDGETFTFYCGISIGAKKKVGEREEAIRHCSDDYLRAYYKTLDESWLHDCWNEIEKKITSPQWPEMRAEAYMYFLDRAQRFSITGRPLGFVLNYMKGLKVKLKQEISPDMPISVLKRSDESLRNIRPSKSIDISFESGY